MSLENRKSGRRRPEQLQQADFSRDITLLATHADPRTRLIARLLWHTGLTPRELVNLQRRDLDTHAQILTIRPENTKHGNGRTAKLSTRLARELNSRTKHKQPREHLFTTRQSPQLTTRRVEQLIKKAGKDAGVNLTPRDLRNAYLHAAAKNAKDDEELKQLTGLKSARKQAILNQEEQERLEDTLNQTSLRDKALAKTILETGATLNDTLNLTEQDVKGRQLTLNQERITLSTQLARELEQLAKQTDNHLFRTRQSTQLTARRAEQVINDTGKRAGIRRLTPRLLRNTARRGGAP
ncbi:tyrosine-type recombinase/integrase [Candidatus Woesearchaeota archaeon]|nr:tyrosine-type recombinase/integrase [Candidatus Woesearchaeota archaeon]